MPSCVATFDWGKNYSSDFGTKKAQADLAKRIKSMSDDEFDLFLSCVVMGSSKAQIMGLVLTEKIQFFRSLRQ